VGTTLASALLGSEAGAAAKLTKPAQEIGEYLLNAGKNALRTSAIPAEVAEAPAAEQRSALTPDMQQTRPELEALMAGEELPAAKDDWANEFMPRIRSLPMPLLLKAYRTDLLAAKRIKVSYHASWMSSERRSTMPRPGCRESLHGLRLASYRNGKRKRYEALRRMPIFEVIVTRSTKARFVMSFSNTAL